MLREVRRRAKTDGMDDRVITLRGDLENLPLGDASVDCSLLSQALHHAARPDRALFEAARIVRPGGRIVVLDLLRHQQDWVREEWADQWLGFEPDQLISWFEQAKCTPLRVDVLTGTTPDLQVLLATAVRNETVFPEKP
jgi:ArsR family transcriptional regulator